jgi:predicted SAM-dependent methyltransferase
MYESSKSARRRYYNGNYITKYFVGSGLDVGCGPDPIIQYKQMFPLISTMRNWDIQDGDAQYLESIESNTFDFLQASHSLEHMQDPRIALANWISVVKPAGYLIITVPDEDLYEHGQWPSKYNSDHKWSFTICKQQSSMPKSINIVDLVKEFANSALCEKIELINDFYRTDISPQQDQTLNPNSECAIEVILKNSKNYELI